MQSNQTNKYFFDGVSSMELRKSFCYAVQGYKNHSKVQPGISSTLSPGESSISCKETLLFINAFLLKALSIFIYGSVVGFHYRFPYSKLWLHAVVNLLRTTFDCPINIGAYEVIIWQKGRMLHDMVTWRVWRPCHNFSCRTQIPLGVAVIRVVTWLFQATAHCQNEVASIKGSLPPSKRRQE